MDSEYQLELVLVRLTLKRPSLSQSLLRVSLVEPARELDGNAAAFETLELPLKRSQKVAELDSLPPFRFSSSSEGVFLIKYEVKGSRSLPVSSITVNVGAFAKQFEAVSKGVFEEIGVGEGSELAYKVLVSRKERQLDLGVVQDEGGEEEAKEEGRMSQSLSRSKRPPQLTLDKKAVENQSQVTPAAQTHQPELLKALPKLKPVESHEQSVSISNLQRKIQSLPLSEIEKVNELIATHHRSDDSQVAAEGISYKIKIVVVMVLVGLMFLLFDTLSDRKVKKAARSHFEDEHEQAREGVRRRKEERLARKKEGKRGKGSLK